MPIEMIIDDDNNNRRRQYPRRVCASPVRLITLDNQLSTRGNQKRTRSSTITTTTTPKRLRRHDNLPLVTMPATPGKKRIKCTCQKRGNKPCDICAAALDA